MAVRISPGTKFKRGGAELLIPVRIGVGALQAKYGYLAGKLDKKFLRIKLKFEGMRAKVP
jgi:hypothetical protein